MGKPIAGRNKFPFGIDGIIVGGAVLADGTTVTDVRISKQRSINRFDLVSSNGATFYPFLQITGVDKNGTPLDKSKSDAELVALLAPGTFYIRAYDMDNVNHGFVIRLMYNKVTLQDGSSLFALNKHYTLPVPVTGVTLNKNATTLTVGAKETLKATVAPSNADNKNVTWKSSDESKATVSSTGEVTAVAAGSANITVSTVDGAKTASCTVTVNAAA